MFGIDDPFIILPYLLSVVCVIFAAWFGLKYWNKDDEKDETRTFLWCHVYFRICYCGLRGSGCRFRYGYPVALFPQYVYRGCYCFYLFWFTYPAYGG